MKQPFSLFLSLISVVMMMGGCSNDTAETSDSTDSDGISSSETASAGTSGTETESEGALGTETASDETSDSEETDETSSETGSAGSLDSSETDEPPSETESEGTTGTGNTTDTDDISSDVEPDTESTNESGDTFRYGINGGHRNASWGDDVQAELEARAGCNSQRISLPERHLDRWGYEIEVNDMKAYAALGMSEQVAFLTAPIRAHSTAPADAEDWELVHYIPANLYEPAVLASGDINPDNYWAKYVYDTVSVYKEWIKVWEIWNEPDYVSDWNATLTWYESPPTAEQLIRFNGSIYEYVRMLRVSKEAALLADPEALIATGGIGYASFLSAILRYSDNPLDGSITEEYPKTGKDYFDVLSFHHYPIYSGETADEGVASYIDHFEELKEVLDAAGKSVAGFETTETGAPRFAVGDYPGGADYAREYLMKVMISAQREGVHGIDWFVLSDGAMEGEGDSSYDYMGLYEDVVALETIDQAVLTDTGTAYRTLGTLLEKARIDFSRTSTLLLDEMLDGAAFLTEAGQPAWALWKMDAEASTTEVMLPSTHSCVVYPWDFSKTGLSETAEPEEGMIRVSVSGDVRVVVCEP